MGDVAEGLAYLHGLGIIHGGVKDQVILVDDSGRACLSDFSQGYREGSQFTSAPYTESMAASLLNIVWKAPELLDGLMKDRPVAPTQATDMYAFGCLVYKVSTLSHSSKRRGNADVSSFA